MAQSHREASRRLFEFAEQQQGFFTTKAGQGGRVRGKHTPVSCAGRELDPRAPRYLPARSVSGRLIGPTLSSGHCGLGTGTRKSRAYTATTRRSAFTILSDLNPAKLHMTVPTGFRRNSDIPGILVLHFADLPESDVATAQGF